MAHDHDHDHEERDYVLGTHDEEIQRLGLQHQVWRPRAQDAWQRAGFMPGQHLLDVGCGPGWATLDLSEIVGRDGHVHAVDRSRRFLDTLERRAEARRCRNVTTYEVDLDGGALPDIQVDGAWIRWVFAFLTDPRALARRIHAVLKPGAPFVIHEYFDYRMWRLAPRVPSQERFVDVVMRTWRAAGGEPDVGLDLPVWLSEIGFEIKSTRPIVEVARPNNQWWRWPQSFVESGVHRFTELGELSAAEAEQIVTDYRRASADPRSLLITPGLLEIIAVRK